MQNMKKAGFFEAIFAALTVDYQILNFSRTHSTLSDFQKTVPAFCGFPP
jgi:hypothetical protein